ncbi:MAG: sulfurtransferase [Alphaproteobacteria bacterium]|nr:sulfurtransferase [Alphaproteobacteria bacterium]
MDSSPDSLTPEQLYARLGTAASPILVDVRRGPAFEAGDTMIVGARRRVPEDVARWRAELPAGTPVVVYCVHGHEVSQNAAAALRAAGIAASYLAGGITAWAEQGLPTRRKLGAARTRWVTRARPKVDRIACPWLVRRFVDPEAEFLYVPSEQVFPVAKETGAIPYDIPGAEPFSHDGELCSFDGFIKVYGIRDPTLDHLALIVRGADTGRPDLTPQSGGLLAVSLGLSANNPDDDHAMLEQGMPVYDALYAWCRSARDETHNWKPAGA